MISRRIIRIKVLQALYSHFKAERTYEESEKELLFSIHKCNDLLFYLLRLVADVRDYAAARIELARQKRVPTYEDLHPNTRFIDNPVIKLLHENKQAEKYIFDKKLSWVNNPEIIREVFTALENTTFYKEYMKKPTCSFKDHKQLVSKIFNDLLANFDPLYSVLEEQSIFWNSEISFVAIQAGKIIKTINPNDTADLELVKLDLVEDDLHFIRTLFRKCTINREKYNKLIDEHTENWDSERIAFMDILLMHMAINEIVEFPTIPCKVSMNEYIEIAKSFSTRNSAQFINGVLDKIVAKLKHEKVIVKQGRGLVGEE